MIILEQVGRNRFNNLDVEDGAITELASISKSKRAKVIGAYIKASKVDYTLHSESKGKIEFNYN